MSEPIAVGLCGKAWEINVKPGNAAQTAALKCWFLELPRQHPFWDCYMLGVTSLRDIVGVPPAKKHYPEAEYELLMVALSPEFKPNPHNRQSLVALEPVNYVNQFDGLTDEEAIKLGLTLVKGLVDGKLIAEPQGVRKARDWWDDNVKRITRTLILCRGMK